MKDQDQQIEIGIATLLYKEDGTFVMAKFTPTLQVEMDDESMTRFGEIDCQGKDVDIKQQARAVFATWFQKLTEIELADREQYIVDTECEEPIRYPNGKVKEVQLRFIFRHL